MHQPPIFNFDNSAREGGGIFLEILRIETQEFGSSMFTHYRCAFVSQRILLMPAVYAVVSFFSYRFFRAYT